MAVRAAAYAVGFRLDVLEFLQNQSSLLTKVLRTKVAIHLKAVTFMDDAWRFRKAQGPQYAQGPKYERKAWHRMVEHACLLKPLAVQAAKH